MKYFNLVLFLFFSFFSLSCATMSSYDLKLKKYDNLMDSYIIESEEILEPKLIESGEPPEFLYIKPGEDGKLIITTKSEAELVALTREELLKIYNLLNERDYYKNMYVEALNIANSRSDRIDSMKRIVESEREVRRLEMQMRTEYEKMFEKANRKLLINRFLLGVGTIGGIIIGSVLVP